MTSLLRAANFAAAQHSSQRRKGGNAEPYVNHLLEVAQLVAEALDSPDEPLLMAALLHDIVEDTDVSPEELARLFGPDVASLVAEVTDDRRLSNMERKRLQVEMAPTKSKRAQMIRIADKISNLRSLLHSPPQGWSDAKKREYFEWAKQVVAGLSNPNRKLLTEFEHTCGLLARAQERV